MKKHYFYFINIVLAVFLSWNCSKESNPLKQIEEKPSEETLNGEIQIKTERSEYILDEITAENFVVITATLTNISQDTFYTKLGDQINSDIDQDYLWILEFTDGYFEKYIGNGKWNNLELGSSVEGSKVIRILPSKKYNLQSALYTNNDMEGYFRLKVNYYKNNSQVLIDTLSDVSNIFSIHIK